MKTLVGGAIASVMGIILLAVWFPAFLNILAGTIPIVLLMGGGLALYLGFDELKDTWKNEGAAEAGAVDLDAGADEEEKKDE
ncbi:MAG: hypothetical protein SWH61_14475 [Thermodesulfobacteriota bacterium]|nr:hypothetical protein [Thermodesulfobacteriota bacterium]